MQLYSQAYLDNVDFVGSGQSPVVIIPGLFGSTTNWRSFAKNLSASLPVIVIDQRNHGRSPHADSNSYDDMVNDLLSLIDAQIINKAILCGHSMGGKVAMAFALKYPERVEKLAVLDIAPVTYEHSHAPYLEALMQIELPSLRSRAEADQALQAAIPNTSTRLFLLQSLTGGPGKYHWRLNIKVLHTWMSKLVSFPHNAYIGVQSSVPAVFIYGEESDYVPGHENRVQEYFFNAHFERVAGAGHWLHADKPQEVSNILRKFVLNGEKNDLK